MPPMCKPSSLLSLLLAGLFAIPNLAAQAPPKTEDTKPDYSKEAFVVEQYSSKIRFENDGTSDREQTVRVRIQSDAGVQRFGLLTFPYQSSSESFDLSYMRVHKPDGTVVVTPPENVQDMASQITRDAPFYSDLREKHVAVKGLGTGDILEYQCHWQLSKPLAPGEFWLDYSFIHEGIVLQEQLEISVPVERQIQEKSPDLKPVIAPIGKCRVYTWATSNLKNKDEKKDKADQENRVWEQERGRSRQPDVRISSFRSWEEVGRWYGSLQQERVKPTAAIQAKASELTKGATDDEAKIRLLYNYVSTQFRYIGIAFGIGRYQPHSASEVLDNQYGDCKDKHTLLASLLDAVGITASPALISSSREIDPDVPSPGQFDHVITAVTRSNGLLWLDSTPEVSPYGYLLSPLRGKHALVILDGKSATLMVTPADPASAAKQTFQIKAKLEDTGILEGEIDRTVQGDDLEFLLRTAFRSVPLPNWKDLVQRISYSSGFAGDVSEVTATTPEKTDEPFRFSYHYKRKDYPDWPNHRINSPLVPILLPAAVGEDDVKLEHAIWLGSPREDVLNSTVEVPKGYSAELPKALDLTEDFAEYHVSYKFRSGVLTTQRRFAVKLREVPASEYEQYKKFKKAVEDDRDSYVNFSFGRTGMSYQNEIWALPDSENPEAERAYDEARSAVQNQRNWQAAIASLKRAVDVDPKFTRAWLWLGEMYKFDGRQIDLAVEAYRAAIKLDPDRPVGYKALGTTLMGVRKYEEAIPVWQGLLKIAPEDSVGFASLGGALLSLRRLDEAADAFQSAIKLDPENPGFQLSLGSAYGRAGKDEKALTAFKRAIELDSDPVWLNDAAYELAEESKNLPIALEYSHKAVQQVEEVSQKVHLDQLKVEDLSGPNKLSAYWDTLGWVYFRMGDLDQAEKYLRAAWVLSQGAVEADHLGQVNERQNKKEAAVHMYRLSLAASSTLSGSGQTDQTLQRIARLGAKSNKLEHGYGGGEELSQMRTTKLPRIVAGTATAEFFLLIGPGSNVEAAKFVSGSEKLKAADKALTSAKFDFPFPDQGPTYIVRRGVLGCFEVTACSFVVYPVNLVFSVN